MLDFEKEEVKSLDVYRLIFRTMLTSNSHGRISNATTSHALVLIEELLRFAKTSVDIYCKSLSADVWCRDEIIGAMATAFDRGVAFRVLVQEEPDENNRALNFFRKREIIVKEDIVPNGESKPEFNFMVVDHSSFRYEENNCKREGFAYAVNEKFSDVLNKLFDSMYSTGRILGR